MAHLALHFPVVTRKTDSSFRFELIELNELPDRLVSISKIIDKKGFCVNQPTRRKQRGWLFS
jgi:hypothetical protein